MQPGAICQLPPTDARSNRTLYLFEGETLHISGQPLEAGFAARVDPNAELTLQCGALPAELLLLQGRPLDEPVAHHGPFVMNTRAELVQAFRDYQQTGFGDWPADRDDPVHGREQGRFAVHPDGRVERR